MIIKLVRYPSTSYYKNDSIKKSYRKFVQHYGITIESGARFFANHIVKRIKVMNDCCNGLDGGFFSLRIVPVYGDCCALHVFLKNLNSKQS